MAKKPDIDVTTTIVFDDAEPAAEWVDIADLVEWDDNPRVNDHAVADVAASIKRFGFAAPIVARRADREIIAGHTRLKAARELGLTKVPVRWMNLDPADAHLLALADNKVSEAADWDEKALGQLMQGFNAEDLDLTGLGWNDDELSELLAFGMGGGAGGGEGDPPPVPDDPVSVLGQVYELGPHRLVCGDSTDPEAWAQLMDGEKLQAVWTDAPYGVSVNAVASVEEAKKRHRRTDGKMVQNDDMTEEQLQALLESSLGLALKHSRRGSSWYVAAPPGPINYVFATVLRNMKVWRWTLQWVKDRFVLGRADYHHRHEPIFYGWKPGAAHYFVDDRTLDTVLEFPRPGVSKDHPTMKPVPLVEYCLRNSAKSGWLVGDPFGGSGTTLIAAANLDMRARIIELEPGYCDVIRQRWTRYATENGLEPGAGALYG